MGEPSIGFGITKLRGANAVQVGHDVKAKMELLKAQLPEGLSLGVNWDTSVFVEQAIDEILFTLVLASLLTGLVCLLFLGSWSTTLNVLLAIPTSILGTFAVMYVFGFTLNTFTVLGLTLVVGIVVDDAIMVLENIYRHREEGLGKVRAASMGAREITFAAAAATFAIVAIFLPVAFMKGIIGKFFFQFGVTISVAVLISLLEALTLAPMRCSRFLAVEKRGRIGRAGRIRVRASLRALPAHPEAGPPPPRPGHDRGHRALRPLPRHHQAAPHRVRAQPGHGPRGRPLPDARGLEPRCDRPIFHPARDVPVDPARGRPLRRLHRRLRGRRGEHRHHLRDA